MNVLVVDDDPTCLSVLKTILQRSSYEVTAVDHAYDALCNLRARPFDLVLTDVHMPHMDGFELQRQINQEFHLPVIMMSSDNNPEVMYKGVQNGAQYFLVKPIVDKDVKNLWQFSDWWKRTRNNRASPTSEISTTPQENAGGDIAIPSDDTSTETARATKRFVWTHSHHTRFVEALLVLGYDEAVPRTILEFMNVPELRREQVGSHLQKYRQFIRRVLDGSVELETSHWIDVRCYSNFVSGNPHLMLIDQLRREKSDGKLEASNRSGRPKLYMVPSANQMGTSGTAPYHNNLYSTQAFNMGGQGSSSVFNGHNINGAQGIAQGDMSTGILWNSNQFGNNSQQLLGGGQMTNQIFFNEQNPNLRVVTNEQQLGAGQMSVGNLLNGHNIDGGQQLGAGALTDQRSLFEDNLNQGKDGDDYWKDLMADVGMADELGDDIDNRDENSGDTDDTLIITQGKSVEP